jgi:hypothetical protein
MKRSDIYKGSWGGSFAWNNERPTPAHPPMTSVAGAVPQNTVQACRLDGCSKPVVRRNRKYCSRHRCFAEIDYVRGLWDRSDVRGAREAERQLNDLERTAAPVRRTEAVRRLVAPVSLSFSLPGRFPSNAPNIKLVRRQDEMHKDMERTMAPLRSFLAALPAAPRLPLFQREARHAWLAYYDDDPEPLRAFINKYLVKLANDDEPIPDGLRERVLGVLDGCFAPVPFYSPGAWYLFSPAAEEQLIGLARSKFRMTESVKYALSGDLGKRSIASLKEKLPGATLLAWEDIEGDDGSGTLLNRVERYLRSEAQEAPKAYRIAEKRPGYFPSEYTDDSLARFEAIEVMQQRENALPRWIEKAAMSPQERRVYELDQQTDFDTKMVASKLGIDKGHVRVVRTNYTNKIRSAAGI